MCRKRIDPVRRDATGERGFSVTEMLTVLALAALMITFVGPAFAESYRAYKVRSATLELTDALRAARQVAVSTRLATSLTINTAAGSYAWTDSKGRLRTILVPSPVQFVTANPATITFATNGTVTTGAATIALKNNINRTVAHQWTIDLNTVGRITTVKSEVAP
jgi:prepilin-type N-terminal cleavage/methylation domain-containing protein